MGTKVSRRYKSILAIQGAGLGKGIAAGHTGAVFARRLNVALNVSGERRPVPAAWMEQFFLRDFTGHAAFDETLPAGDGILETSFRVDPEEVRSRFEAWLRGRKMIGGDMRVEVSWPGPPLKSTG